MQQLIEMNERRTSATSAQRTPEERAAQEKHTYAYFVSKFAAQFPKFDAVKSEQELLCWEDYWDSVKLFQSVTNCSDMILAYLIKDSAATGSALACVLHGHDRKARTPEDR